MPRLSEPTDNELVAAAQRGDVASFGDLVRKYQNRLCSSLWHICSSRSDAEDATRERSCAPSLDSATTLARAPFTPWLYRIAVNLIISDHRKRKTQNSIAQDCALCDQSQLDRCERPEDEGNVSTNRSHLRRPIHSF
jgi:RNA polymerase sigma-70 factor (ECF subfamily)